MTTTKKGDLLNQMAIISDLIENMNLKSEKETTVLINLEKDEFERIFKLVNVKTKTNLNPKENKFTVGIGEVVYIFNIDNPSLI
jgi:hypothetical protein